MENGIKSFSESITIVEQKTTVKLIVKRKATIEDLMDWRNNYVVPSNGGHITAILIYIYPDNAFFQFQLCDKSVVTFTSLNNIYVI